jgi:hypothetical protein
MDAVEVTGMKHIGPSGTMVVLKVFFMGEGAYVTLWERRSARYVGAQWPSSPSSTRCMSGR